MNINEMTGLGMTDVASRSRSGPVWKMAALTGLILVFYVAIRNYLYVRGGMLSPNFRIIHDAYDFNLFELPVMLLGVALLCVGLAVTWRSSRRALLWVAGIYAFVAVDLFALRYYVTYIEPERLVVHHVRIETPKLSETVRILHLADIQAGSIGPYQEEIFEKIEALRPDLILNTGDFLQVVPPATFESEWPKLHAMITRVHPRLGTYAVFGDTELDAETRMQLHRKKPEDLEPLVMLSSHDTRIDTGGGQISLLGLNLFHSQDRKWAKRSIDPWLEGSDPNDFRILFGHSPNFALGVAEAPIDLCLAGHTHGGQVNLPFYGALVTYSDVPREWASGFRRIGIPYLNVSAGAGSNRRHGLPPIRFNCPTEMTLIELVPMRSIR